MHFERFYPLAGRKDYCEGVSETNSAFCQRLSFFLRGESAVSSSGLYMEYFENGKSSQRAAHVTEKSKR